MYKPIFALLPWLRDWHFEFKVRYVTTLTEQIVTQSRQVVDK